MTARHRTPRRNPWPLLLATIALLIATPAAAADEPEPVTFSAATCEHPEGVAHVPDNTDTIAYLNHGDPDVPAKGYWAAHEIDRLDDEDEGVVGVWPYDFSDVELECDGPEDVDEPSDAPEGDSVALVDGSAELPNTGRS